MRVLHFLPAYLPAWQYGGPILSVSRLCEGLVHEGVDVRVITTNAGLPDFPPDQLCVSQQVNGVEVTYYPVDHQWGTIRSKALVEALPEHMSWAEILHLSSIWQPLGIPVQEAAHSAGVPVIQTTRGALGPYSWRRGWWKKVPYFLCRERPLLQLAAGLHCTTKQEVLELGWLLLKPTATVLPNPLDLSQLWCDRALGQQFRISYGLPLNQPLFLVAGRLHHKKGLDLLPRVLNKIANKHWQILFVGSDSDGTSALLRRAFENYGLADRAHWLPALPADHLIGPYNAADWLLLPSRHENFGNVVIESLACGCGVITSDKVGVSDMIEGSPGVFIARRELATWTHALEAALHSKRPGALSETFVKEYFSKSLISWQALALYQSVTTYA